MMQLADFADLLDRLGEDLSVWPESQRQPAAELLLASEQARDLLRDANILRQALSAPPVRADRALVDRIMQRVSADLPPPSTTAAPALPQDTAPANVPADASVPAPQPRAAAQTDCGNVERAEPSSGDTPRGIEDVRRR
jgi:hypothetical protein